MKKSLTPLDILTTLKTLNLCADLDAPIPTSELTFDRILSSFLKSKSPHETLILPVLASKGRQVDLQRLFCVVREKGGYLTVTACYSWGDVAESIGFGSQLGPSVKLLYWKYLKTLESSVQEVLDKKADPTKGLFPLLKRKRVSTLEIPIGPYYQATIPKIKFYSDSDPSFKYLGTNIWPMDNNPRKISDISPKKGKTGRKKCECLVPGSIRCVKFHIAESRLKLKQELGESTLYKMGFHKMGEEFSLSWNEEEEERFKLVIREIWPDKFWDKLRMKFKHKGWRNLVGYYFNVFLIKRRAYQNRLVPDGINSDDDKMEPSFLDGTLNCVQNRQCLDFDH